MPENPQEVYDDTNVFAKILRQEIPAKIIYESTHALAFFDAFPKAPLHALVIPKGTYRDLKDFLAHATTEEILDFWKTVQATLDKLDLKEGFRLLSNSGAHGGQEVPHFHIHLCGGEKLGPMLAHR